MALSKIRPRVSSNGVLYPLDFVYARSGVEMPEAEVIEADSIPQPYRSLLVHKTDMTLTLELLRDGGVKYESRPVAFLAIKPNPEMMGVFWMREARTLFGRRTEMIHDGAKIGDIVEVLPLA